MDFLVQDQPPRQDAMREGLRWIDAECRQRYNATFVHCSEEQRRGLLDDIAWPERARPEMQVGVEFFSRFRDLTADGFWTTRMGIDDLRYAGNRADGSWDGCPDEVLLRLGLKS
jgi:hypothetical protein